MAVNYLHFLKSVHSHILSFFDVMAHLHAVKGLSSFANEQTVEHVQDNVTDWWTISIIQCPAEDVVTMHCSEKETK